MAITASLVKELRERTGVGMMECKKALVESNGDIEAAIEAMRKKGQAKAAKKASRVASEGIVLTAQDTDAKKAVMVEVNSETDFVAKDENFTGFANAVANAVLASGEVAVETLKGLALQPSSDETIEEARLGLVNKIGENIQIRRATLMVVNEGAIGCYVHSGKIGVLVHVKGSDESLARDIAMHVAASNPEVISPEEVTAERVEKEKEVFKAQALEEGKPVEIVEKMIMGRTKKFVNEISLLGQEFVKDPSKTVGALLKEKSAEVIKFERFELGEGIEKVESNFAEEVMSQVRGE